MEDQAVLDTVPAHNVNISKDRIWVDGCFDFAHHGTPSGRLAVHTPQG